jgi:hypothetical protein
MILCESGHIIERTLLLWSGKSYWEVFLVFDYELLGDCIQFMCYRSSCLELLLHHGHLFYLSLPGICIFHAAGGNLGC